MIIGFTVIFIGIALLVGVLCVVLGLLGKRPADISILSVVAVELLVLAQIVIAAIAPAVGNEPTGNLLEFWVYLGTAAIIPPLALVWALVERTRWSTVILGAAALSIAVMVYRMHAIWTVQLA